ncbi:MAG TPA: prolyl oligopeptidase family serine peptidase [Rudaea sp.]
MTFRSVRPTFAVALLVLAAHAAAQESKPVMLAKVEAVPEADFARHATLGPPALSPDGQHIAVSVHSEENGDSKYQLAVLHLPDLKYVSRLDMVAQYLPIDITWVDNKRLVMGVGRETAFSEAPAGTGDIIAVDIDGKNKRMLYSDSSRSSTAAMMNILKLPIGFGAISGRPDQANGHFYLTVYPAAEHGGSDAQANRTLVFDVDATNGNVKELGSIGADGYQFLVHDGVARYAFGQDNNLKLHVFYRASADQAWTELPASVVGKDFTPQAISADGTKLYSVGNPDGGPNVLAISNLDGTDRKVLASNARMDITETLFSPAPHVPYAAVAYEGKPVITYLDDSRYAKALKALNAQFSDHYVSFVDMSQDGSMALVHAVSDRDPGTYALFDMKTSNLRPLYQSKPWLKPEQLGERRPFWFKASSGTELGGFITLPPGRSAKNLPTILLPHGGPIGPSHRWMITSWDDAEAQFLASRGYAVVQVNYRGSGDRGRNFEESGKLQMGTGMLQDQLDAMKWAVAQGYTDAGRQCIYGASYGGYAAYEQPVYAPQGTFKCSVAIAGVADIRIQTERSDTRRSRGGRNFLREAWGMDDPKYLAANSAITQIDKFNVPVLIIHGEDDRRVPVQNARAMRDALEKAGKPVEYMTRPKEGHGFFKEENNTDRYKITEAFLQKYLGPGAPPAG